MALATLSPGRATLRPDAPHNRRHQRAAWEVGEGPFSAAPLPFLTSVVPPGAPEPTGKPRRQTLSPERPGLAPEASAAWLWASTALPWSPRAREGEGRSAPSLGPNCLGYLLILVGTLV